MNGIYEDENFMNDGVNVSIETANSIKKELYVERFNKIILASKIISIICLYFIVFASWTSDGFWEAIQAPFIGLERLKLLSDLGADFDSVLILTAGNLESIWGMCISALGLSTRSVGGYTLESIILIILYLIALVGGIHAVKNIFGKDVEYYLYSFKSYGMKLYIVAIFAAIVINRSGSVYGISFVSYGIIPKLTIALAITLYILMDYYIRKLDSFMDSSYLEKVLKERDGKCSSRMCPDCGNKYKIYYSSCPKCGSRKR